MMGWLVFVGCPFLGGFQGAPKARPPNFIFLEVLLFNPYEERAHHFDWLVRTRVVFLSATMGLANDILPIQGVCFLVVVF